jgi:uncharacterized repeat protein (TIGR03803 family)
MKIQAKRILVMLALLAGIQLADAQFTFIPLYSFTGGDDGANPVAGLVQASDGNLYGTTHEGGTNGYGTIFKVPASGVVIPLYSFTDGRDGADPLAGLALAGNGDLYGTAPGGGANGAGTVFEVSVSAPAPVLSILSDGHQSVLSWPASANNYVLQSTTNLASPNWVTISNAIPGMAVTVTNSLPAQYFRLINP